jgi:hypothetical protein
MTSPTPYTLVSPALVDIAIGQVNAKLTANLSWLTSAYGRVQALVKDKGGQQYTYPGIYTGGSGKGEYLDLLPDTHLGNYTFFEVREPEKISGWKPGELQRIEAPFGLVCWFDFRSVYSADWQGRTVGNAISDLLAAISGGMNNTALDINEIYYTAERIYRGYSHKEIDRQFLMKPFGGFRLDGTLIYTATC